MCRVANLLRILELILDNKPSATYKGFDLYPLVYRIPPVASWPRTKPDRTFNASVVICREGGRPDGEDPTRVFRIESAPWENIGSARRGAIEFGQRVIDGLVPGESVSAL